jgi:hypothetical protein
MKIQDLKVLYLAFNLVVVGLAHSQSNDACDAKFPYTPAQARADKLTLVKYNPAIGANMNYCNLLKLVPTQLSVGTNEVNTKLAKLEKKVQEDGVAKGLADYQNDNDGSGFDHWVKYIVGPRNPKQPDSSCANYYIVDGNHDSTVYYKFYKKNPTANAAALWVPCVPYKDAVLASEYPSFPNFTVAIANEATEAGRTFTKEEKFNSFAEKIFRKGIVYSDYNRRDEVRRHYGLVWPFTNIGRLFSNEGRYLTSSVVSALPAMKNSANLPPIAQLSNDACRSFVYRARKYFEDKCNDAQLYNRLPSIPYQEFYFANYARDFTHWRAWGGCSSVAPKDYEIFRQEIGTDSASKYLPGWRKYSQFNCD